VDQEEAVLAGRLSKVDLLTSMVGEFPELQGIMGRYYAQAQGYSDSLSQALEEQYLPRGQGDALPNSKLGVVLSLADKFDALVGLFAVGQEPKADKDPFALRRMALGIVRMCIELELDLDVHILAKITRDTYSSLSISDDIPEKVAVFIMQRLPTLYKDSGIDMRLVRAVEALSIFNPSDFNKRLVVLQKFYQGDDAAALAEVHKRVNNILKKNTIEGHHDIVSGALVEPAEKALHAALCDLTYEAQNARAQQDYERLLQLGVSLREVVDLFFVEVKVISEIEVEKRNRITLLAQLRDLFAQVGDLSFLA
jgi:glycyl-tRNA synthetase beta chain